MIDPCPPAAAGPKPEGDDPSAPDSTDEPLKDTGPCAADPMARVSRDRSSTSAGDTPELQTSGHGACFLGGTDLEDGSNHDRARGSLHSDPTILELQLGSGARERRESISDPGEVMGRDSRGDADEANREEALVEGERHDTLPGANGSVSANSSLRGGAAAPLQEDSRAGSPLPGFTDDVDGDDLLRWIEEDLNPRGTESGGLTSSWGAHTPHTGGDGGRNEPHRAEGGGGHSDAEGLVQEGERGGHLREPTSPLPCDHAMSCLGSEEPAGCKKSSQPQATPDAAVEPSRRPMSGRERESGSRRQEEGGPHTHDAVDAGDHSHSEDTGHKKEPRERGGVTVAAAAGDVDVATSTEEGFLELLARHSVGCGKMAMDSSGPAGRKGVKETTKAEGATKAEGKAKAKRANKEVKAEVKGAEVNQAKEVEAKQPDFKPERTKEVLPWLRCCLDEADGAPGAVPIPPRESGKSNSRPTAGLEQPMSLAPVSPQFNSLREDEVDKPNPRARPLSSLDLNRPPADGKQQYSRGGKGCESEKRSPQGSGRGGGISHRPAVGHREVSQKIRELLMQDSAEQCEYEGDEVVAMLRRQVDRCRQELR